MLALTRKKGQGIVIKTEHGEEISLYLEEAKGSSALILFDAPKGIRIWRKEIWDAAINAGTTPEKIVAGRIKT